MFNAFCRLLMKLTGWRFEGELPALPSYIITVAPHTSNWDFIVGVMARGALGERIHFLGKHQLFIPPWGWFFRAIGGSPVDRRKNNNLVDAVSALFEEDKHFKLALAPEGTRSKVTRWKTGFYHIAVKANVPIVTVGLDFAERKVVLGPARATTGNMQADMDAIIAFYRGIMGRFPKHIPDYVPSEKDKSGK